MGRATFRRPDGREGSYGQWLAEVSAKWSALSAVEQAASRGAAATRLATQIKAQADDGPTLMHIYDEIGWFGVWPADVAEALAGIKGDLEVHMHSPGGNVFDGLAIYESLKQYPGTVSVVVDGLAASAASFIAMAAAPGKLQMTPNSTMMIHDAWGLCAGNAADMTEMAGLLEETSDNIASIYAERSGLTAAEYRALMQAETWAVGQKAVDLRLADSVREHAAEAPPAAVAVAASVPWQVTILNGSVPLPPAVNEADHGSGASDHADTGPAWSPDQFKAALERKVK
jgi:ATP-dependent Clp endopeptidase proteolytic subunit ClpP